MPASNQIIKTALDEGIWTATRDGKRIGSNELTINPSSVNVSLHPRIVQIVPKNGFLDLHDADSFSVFSYDCTDGLILRPGLLYLGAVCESFDCAAPLWVTQYAKDANGISLLPYRVQTHFYPKIDGRSTTGRCGLGNHITAGHGDWGFGSGASALSVFTLELTTVLPTKVWAGDEVGQVLFEPLQGVPSETYKGAYIHQSEGPRLPVIGRDRFQPRGEGK